MTTKRAKPQHIALFALSACFGCRAADPARPADLPDPTPPADSILTVVRRLSISGQLDLANDTVRGIVTIVNRTQTAANFGLRYWPCDLVLQLHSADGYVVWNQVRNGPPKAGGCKSWPRKLTSNPGDSIVLRSDDVPRHFLSATLSRGSYNSTVTLALGHVTPYLEGLLSLEVDTIAYVPSGLLEVR